MASPAVKLSVNASATDRILTIDPATMVGDYAAPLDAIGELWAIDDEIVQVIDATSDTLTVNRGLWFSVVASHTSGTYLRLIDLHRQGVSSNPGALVELFRFDTVWAGDNGGPYYFVNGFMTQKSLTDIIKIKGLTNIAGWTLLNGVTVDGGVIGPDGTPDAFRLNAPSPIAIPNAATGFAVPDDLATYHIKCAIKPVGVTAVIASFLNGSTVAWGVCVDQYGNTFQPSGANLGANLSVTESDDGWFLIEFDAQNNAAGNNQLDVAYFPGYVEGVSIPPIDLNYPIPAYALVTVPNVFGPPGQLYWGGIPFTPLPIFTSGFEQSTRGALPTPHIKVANGIIGNLLATLVDSYNDLVGARLYRFRTFAKYLDSGSDPDIQKHFRPDVYIINRKVAHNKLFIEWELATVIDQQGLLLPGRQLLRDYCPWQYRRWDNQNSKFDYTNVECPYTGGTYFDVNDNETTDPSLDHCSKRLTGCILRFGSGNPLPYGAFPGVSLWR